MDIGFLCSKSCRQVYRTLLGSSRVPFRGLVNEVVSHGCIDSSIRTWSSTLGCIRGICYTDTVSVTPGTPTKVIPKKYQVWSKTFANGKPKKNYSKQVELSQAMQCVSGVFYTLKNWHTGCFACTSVWLVYSRVFSWHRSWAVILTDLIHYHFGGLLAALLLLKSTSLFTAYLKLKFLRGSFK